MSADLLVKDLRERRTSALSVGLGLTVMAVFVLGLYAGMRETLDELTRQFPEALLSFVGGGTGPGGYVVGELFDLIAPLLLVGYAIAGGASAGAGEEENHTLGLLAAHPLSRRRILLSKTAGLLLAVTAVTGLFWLGVVLAATVYDVGLGVGEVAAACLHLLALALAFAAIALAVAAGTGRPGLGAAVAGVLAAASYISEAVLPLADLARWARLSPWHYYAGSAPLENGVDPAHLLVLLVILLVGVAVALLRFDHRDLKG